MRMLYNSFMKHYFMVNPVAGKGKAQTELVPKIIQAAKDAGIEYEIIRTINIGDAETRVKSRCIEEPGIPKRFYACGGDGTLNEVVNGLYGFPDVELACIPAGTGNDFVRNFGDAKKFLDLDAQINSIATPTDVMKYELTGETERTSALSVLDVPIKHTGYAINMFNIGFDANVVSRTSVLKKHPFLKGTRAYVAGVIAELLTLKSLSLKVAIDGGEVLEFPKVLLAGIGNGRFSGGGFDGIPMAITDDGLIDVMVIKYMSRRMFISLVKSYHSGTHFEEKRLKKYLNHISCSYVEIEPDRKIELAIDGEPIEIDGKMRFSVAKDKINFCIPG